MFCLDRYITTTERRDITVDLRNCSMVCETRPELQINWRNIKQDAVAGLKKLGGWLRDVAIGSDVSLASLALAVGYAR